jgi:3',5'-cyclic AMP phosphodiesterase CpdA
MVPLSASAGQPRPPLAASSSGPPCVKASRPLRRPSLALLSWPLGIVLMASAASCDGGSGTCSPGQGGAAGGGPGGGGAGGAAEVRTALLGAPLVFAPTTHGFGVSVVLAQGDPASLRARVRPNGQPVWGAAAKPSVRATDLAEWAIGGLSAGAAYDYQIVVPASGGELPLFQGTVTTQRPAGTPFTFALVTDTHIGSDLSYSNQGDPTTLEMASAAIADARPDFVVNLGDILDFHEFGFNVPPKDGSITRAAYLNYRRTFGTTVASAAHFVTIGGWDSESGCNTLEEINRSRDQRLLYLPGPGSQTYPEGGSANQDYYAFTWGDALFVVLNVFTYTPTCHLLSEYPGSPDDWTLGDDQLAWLGTTLASSGAKWKVLLIHHPVGGDAGDFDDSAYGRGGGRAANVGQQATVHALMRQYGVQIFFYGHDHVFTDMTVDNIHYSLPGSAGAIWYFTPDQTGYAQDWEVPGWGRVTVGPDGVHVQFVDLSGKIIYEYSLGQPADQ